MFFSRNNDSIFDELTCQDADIIGDVDFGADITGKDQYHVHLLHAWLGLFTCITFYGQNCLNY